MSQEPRLCPECGDRLSFDARACACGWGKATARKGRGVPSSPSVAWERTCTWQSGALRCQYPVGAFYDHASRGRCIFHRATGEGVEAARIAEESRFGSPEEYVVRAKRHMYGAGDNASVRELRERLKKRADGERVGIASTGALAAMVERNARAAADVDDPFGESLA